MNSGRLLIPLFLLVALLSGCKKKYSYIIGKETEKTIRCESDSAAYMKVFIEFTTLRKFYTDIANSGAEAAIKYIPDYFYLFDEHHTDITKKVSFNDKQRIEDFITARINSRPNKFKKDKPNITSPH